MVNSLNRTAPLIKNVEFTNMDYRDFVTDETEGMFIYCDPPYAYIKYPIKYRRDVKHYDTFDIPLFWETVRKWSKKNVGVTKGAEDESTVGKSPLHVQSPIKNMSYCPVP